MKNKILKFMYGRYGPDELYRFLFIIFILLVIIGLFIKNIILLLLELLIIFIMFYRAFSKKIYKRSDENVFYLKCKKTILKPFTNFKRVIKNRKTNMYIKCHKCKTTIKLPLPKTRGIKHLTCPTCKKRLTIIALEKKKNS